MTRLDGPSPRLRRPPRRTPSASRSPAPARRRGARRLAAARGQGPRLAQRPRRPRASCSRPRCATSRGSRRRATPPASSRARGLLLLAPGPARGQRRAWAIAVIALRRRRARAPAPRARSDRRRRPRPRCSSRSSGIREDFRAQADPSSLLRSRASSCRSTCVGVLRLHVDHACSPSARTSPPTSASGQRRNRLKGMVGLDGPYTYGREAFGDFFEITLIMLGVIGLLTLPLPAAADLRPGRAAERRAPPSAPRRSCRRWGDDTLDYFALRPRQELLLLRRRATR